MNAEMLSKLTVLGSPYGNPAALAFGGRPGLM
jgi:hypothetical protein